MVSCFGTSVIFFRDGSRAPWGVATLAIAGAGFGARRLGSGGGWRWPKTPVLFSGKTSKNCFKKKYFTVPVFRQTLKRDVQKKKPPAAETRPPVARPRNWWLPSRWSWKSGPKSRTTHQRKAVKNIFVGGRNWQHDFNCLKFYLGTNAKFTKHKSSHWFGNIWNCDNLKLVLDKKHQNNIK